ncbi:MULTISPECIES: hypothetical protein [Ancylobacter]|uniref:DUF2842 domain-containing protein n=1 Tax=Ancylobacter defluvii TaxID=1282440 RepID=A0A9W6JTY4_9HYPH|nr:MULTISPECIES: hypothetical protein [Ancylobacter]MBS7587321.1 hypothetical protein [Ancylobacter defluvii]MDR6951993.1 antibiotic biosynthesis monooxygenase (ABM) superfamily enzyme [Ancylobacter sp. 3268]GLK82010.1 hypothetical protein GCM10017653_00790 [Ancylobacter defluvii]
MAQAPNFSRSRFTVAVMLAVYPLVTALLYAVMPLTPDWPLWMRTLVVVPVMAVAMVWVLIPRIHRHLSLWLHP